LPFGRILNKLERKIRVFYFEVSAGIFNKGPKYSKDLKYKYGSLIIKREKRRKMDLFIMSKNNNDFSQKYKGVIIF